MTAPVTPQQEVWATFAGAIDQGSINRLFTAFALATQNKVPRLHLLFQSSGGYVGDGIALYNVLKALPLELTMYNAGNVASIAAIAFLGAKTRKASAHAAFMIHRTTRQELATATRLKAATESLLLDDKRTEDILRAHITLDAEKWKELDYHDVVFSAQEAVNVGMAQTIGEFAPPVGSMIYNI